MTKTTKQIEELIEKRVKEELNPIDAEQRYRDELDECYPEVKIGYLTFSPSKIVEELDPTAFRCGVADMTGTDEQLTEIDGEYYNTDEVAKIREEVESENEVEE